MLLVLYLLVGLIYAAIRMYQVIMYSASKSGTELGKINWLTAIVTGFYGVWKFKLASFLLILFWPFDSILTIIAMKMHKVTTYNELSDIVDAYMDKRV